MATIGRRRLESDDRVVEGIRRARRVAGISYLFRNKMDWPLRKFVLSIAPLVLLLAALEVPSFRGRLVDIVSPSWLFVPVLALVVWATIFHTGLLVRVLRRFNDERLHGVMRWIDKNLDPGFRNAVGGDGEMDRDEVAETYQNHATNWGAAIVLVWMVQGAAVVLCVATVCALSALHDPGSFPAMLDNGVSGLEAVYFSVVTLATVGYGDIHAGDSLGQVIVIACGGLTIIFVTFGAALVISSFVSLQDQLRKEVAAFNQ